MLTELPNAERTALDLTGPNVLLLTAPASQRDFFRIGVAIYLKKIF